MLLAGDGWADAWCRVRLPASRHQQGYSWGAVGASQTDNNVSGAPATGPTLLSGGDTEHHHVALEPAIDRQWICHCRILAADENEGAGQI